MNPHHRIACGCGVIWLCVGAPAHAQELHGYLTLVSDYVFRGASQSNGDPTVQAGIDYLDPSGVFVGVFVARTDFPENPFGSNPGSIQLDAYLGFSHAAGIDWSWDIAALRHEFPDSQVFDYSYNELAVNLHFRDVLRLGATVSDDAAAGGSSGWTAEIELRQPLGDRFQVSGALGHYEFARTDWSDYLYWDLGVSATVARLTFDIRYFDMNSDRAGFAGPQLTGARLVGSVSVGF